ncbi:MAG: UMP kinase [Minisyncoccia bacterium]|jgi:uridylate kinase
MKHSFKNPVVVALGGSIIYPDGIDTAFLKKFKKFTAPFLRRGVKFVLVIGGGNLARRFQDAAAKVAPVTSDDRDWIGIHATRLNGHLVRTIFRKVADPVMIDARHKLPRLMYPVTVAAGWRPGWSTDYVAAVLAHDFGAGEYVVAGKPAFVYDKNPDEYRDARPHHALSWKKYRAMIPKKWMPGAHAPVDPIAAKFSDEHRLSAVIIDGRNLANLKRYLEGKRFDGTVISKDERPLRSSKRA